MQENYVKIFSSYLAELLETEKLKLPDVIALMRDFKPVCDNIKTRAELIQFIDDHVQKYLELKDLKNKLSDPNFIFNF